MLNTSNSKSGHRLARPWGGWLWAAALTAGVAVAPTAHAQVDTDAGVTGQQSGSVSVVDPVRTVKLRTTSPNTRQHWISHQDCVDDVKLTFRVAVNSPNADTSLFAYVGKSASLSSTMVQDSCLYGIARNDPARCKELSVDSKNTGSPLVVITAKDLNTRFGIDICGEAASADSTGPISLQFYFLLQPGARDLGSNDSYAIYENSGIDLWGPEAPTSLEVTSGDEELQLEFAGVTGAVGFNFYSDDGTGVPDGGIPVTTSTSGGGSSSTATTGSSSTSAAATTGTGGSTSTGAGGASASSASTGAGGSGGAGGASASSTSAGAGGSGGVGGVSSTVAATTGTMMSAGVTSGGNVDACNPTSEQPVCVASSYLLVAGEVPTYERAGELRTTATKGSITDLKNGQAFVVAVAAYDDVGNVGKLSELKCGTPQPVDSILRVYKCKGGLTESGCGFCSVGGDQGVSFTALASAGLFVLGFAVRRSRRPRVTSAERGAR